MTNFISHLSVADLNSETPERDLVKIFVSILTKVLTYSKECVKVITDNKLVVSLLKFCNWTG